MLCYSTKLRRSTCLFTHLARVAAVDTGDCANVGIDFMVQRRYCDRCEVLRFATAFAPCALTCSTHLNPSTQKLAVHRPHSLERSSIRNFSSSHEDKEPATQSSTTKYLGVVYHANKVKKDSAELETGEPHHQRWRLLDGTGCCKSLRRISGTLLRWRSHAAEFSGRRGGHAGGAKKQSRTMWNGTRQKLVNVMRISFHRYHRRISLWTRLRKLSSERKPLTCIQSTWTGSLADLMVFATGRSRVHMRRMADLLIKSMKAREIVDEFDYVVEGRDCDDWMIADGNNIVVHLMRAETRRILALEEHWENMVHDKHRVNGDMNDDEYMDKYGTSELIEYLNEDDHPNPEDEEGAGVEWK
ncbi:hypothetical protein PsorP6_001248 [Peronosclerospora sorghi]|uniref:Uncharacterized protein n=1 Tax=Peronosclerospora sorghi TaxID=230839 RepID=A0ACC0WRP0_9STRA|nr:hypothetical protein PsorP6_001248 [Peronosclerospora sorghi]